MFLNMLFIFSYLNILFSHFVPYIDVEPRVINPTIDHRRDDGFYDRALDGCMYEGSFMIQFSVQYRTLLGEFSSLIAEYYDLAKIKVTLKKFVRKQTQYEMYNDEIHCPECIDLPSTKDTLHGFGLFIGKETFNVQRHELKQGCQLISLYYNIYDDRIESAISALMKLMKLQNVSDSFKFAYQFYIETATTELHKCACPGIKNDPSMIFTIRFKENNLVHLSEVFDTINYHIPKDTQ